MSPNCDEVLLPDHDVRIQVPSIDNRGEKYAEEEDNEDHNEEVTECGKKQVFYGAGDCLLSAALVAPCVVGFWRGTWSLMELSHHAFPHAQSFILGIVVHVCFALGRWHLLSRSEHAWRGPPGGASRWLRERVLARLYTYIFAVANIMHWRGGWGIMDQAVAAVVPDESDPHRPVLMAVFTLLCYVSISYLRSARNLLASPFFLFPDSKEPTYMFTTRFKRSNTRDTWLYVLDCVFSVAVVGTLVAFVWRGSWAIFDVYLLPDNKTRSYWTSMVAGYIVVALTFGSQAPMSWAAARLDGTPRLLLADLYHFVSFLATVNVWRGIWGILDEYLYPENPKLSNWLTHGISMIALILLNCSNSILVRGVYIDAEEPGGECVVFPCHYIRYYYHRDKTKENQEEKRQEDASLAPLQATVADEKERTDEKV